MASSGVAPAAPCPSHAGHSSRSWSRSRVWSGRRSLAAPQIRGMDLPHLTSPTDLPKHILDVWVIVLIILATILIMTVLVLCPATAVIIYRVRAHPTRNGIV
ncbi:small integral membrane protein 3 isoform X1 [Vidua chalybeata]|uniref:small integral membrane protein 3 isoform X1 n=1 Tax=Vidua chalybeata TaxID=81927 RepID=UPI0023A8CF40|nr:small integral membrane protein 3 isoform X1 [Vidua chalybeata]